MLFGYKRVLYYSSGLIYQYILYIYSNAKHIITYHYMFKYNCYGKTTCVNRQAHTRQCSQFVLDSRICGDKFWSL